MLQTFTKLLEMNLLSKESSLENLDKILPFLLHPNNWIRNQALIYVTTLSDPQIGILGKAEVFCLVKPKLKKFLKQGQKVFQIYGDDLNISKLVPPLSREVYDKEIQGQKVPKLKFDIKDSNLSDEDKYSKGLI